MRGHPAAAPNAEVVDKVEGDRGGEREKPEMEGRRERGRGHGRRNR